MELYISPAGDDRWSGRLPKPNRAKTDCPLATLAGARNRLRELRGLGGKNKSPSPAEALAEPVTVWIRGGIYHLSEPVIFGPQDSYPVLYAAYPGEKPIFSGGQRLQGWRETVLHGCRAWVLDLPAVAEGKWEFRSLFANGRRALRPRLPEDGLYRMEAVPGLNLPAGWGNGGQRCFIAAPGQIFPFTNPTDVEVVYVHFWIEERSPVASLDLGKREVVLQRPSRSAMVGSFGSQLADYYYDNVFEALKKPGQWYLDRRLGRLYYLPLAGEKIATAEIYAPRGLQLLALLGEPEKERWVEFIRFQGLTFCHTDWRHPSNDGANFYGASNVERSPAVRRYSRGSDAAASQAACDVPGVITMMGCRHCSIEDCTIEHIGWYGVEIGEGCSSVRVMGNTICDMGAGGVKINGAAAAERSRSRETFACRITDNHIHHGGEIFHSAVGILSMHACAMVIAYNHIHDLYYSGISCGWEWGYQANVSRDNLIEANHIHHLGKRLLSDMGGIYTLGVQPGTAIRRNLIHHIESAHYGGWCIYPDEGSSHIIIEDNVCYDADRQLFHQHYGRENIVRNNIFAFGGESLAAYSRADNHNGITFIRNIFLTDGKPIFSAGHSHALTDKRFCSDLNLFYDVSKRPLACEDQRKRRIEWRGWLNLGQDSHSLVADPRFRDWRKRDFRLLPRSPALKIGFRPIDLSDIGPRPR